MKNVISLSPKNFQKPLKSSNIPKGRRGEALAEEYLKKKGYKIIGRNFSKRGGELDLITTNDKTLVFVEVKTRWSKEYGVPEESVTPRKLRTLIRTVEYYTLLHPELPELQRIDVIAVDMDSSGKLLDIRHIENVTG